MLRCAARAVSLSPLNKILVSGGIGLATEAVNQSKTSVTVLDPLLLLEPERYRLWDEQRQSGSSQSSVSLNLDTYFLKTISSDWNLSLEDSDDPLGAWTVGDSAEIFQYKFTGSHTVRSGWTSVCETKVVNDVLQGNRTLISWRDFLELVKQEGGERLTSPITKHEGLPLLFAGRLLDCPSASVYTFSKNGSIRGMMMTNDFESVDD
uniref:Uncharacterized protein n=1 Tax=Tetraselmis sp. GSL018 TaxID=582737 RepID=A0A061S358_9CHLO